MLKSMYDRIVEEEQAADPDTFGPTPTGDRAHDMVMSKIETYLSGVWTPTQFVDQINHIMFAIPPAYRWMVSHENGPIQVERTIEQLIDEDKTIAVYLYQGCKVKVGPYTYEPIIEE